jgi:filamentous hemagglutinin family protein
LPSGGQVAAGQVSLATSGPAAAPTLTVTQGSDRAIVNWAAFDVGRDATVRFDQPSASAAILNRVVGADPSRIFGRLTANGQVFLVNPNGVYFSPTSSVDVGAFVASTLSIGDADFLAGRLDFRRLGATGTIVNEGAIRSALGGYVALLAPEVRNAGLIMAEAGSVLLAAGEAVSFNFDPAAGVTGLLVEPARVQALVDNGRIVRAPGGQVIVSAQAHNEMAAGVIRNTGEIAANGITTDGGRVMLGASESVEQGGLVDASSATGKGGSVDITAPTIALLDASSLLATGELGGGRIHVGGGWQGAGPLPQARRVTQAANSLVDDPLRPRRRSRALVGRPRHPFADAGRRHHPCARRRARRRRRPGRDLRLRAPGQRHLRRHPFAQGTYRRLVARPRQHHHRQQRR